MKIKLAAIGILMVLLTSPSMAMTRHLETYDYLGIPVKQTTQPTNTTAQDTQTTTNKNHSDYTGLPVTKSLDSSQLERELEFSYAY